MTDTKSVLPLDAELLCQNENCRCEHAFEGKTARDRAFENYLQERGSDDERRAWELLQILRNPELPDEQAFPVFDELDELQKRGSNVATYAYAESGWFALQFKETRDLAVQRLEMLVAREFMPARGFLAECSWRLTMWDQDEYPKLEELLAANLDDEDCLLTAGRMAALDWQFSKDFVLQVQTALRDRAEKGHRDALRLLLFQANEQAADNRFPYHDWAKERIQELAKADDPFALVYLGQQKMNLIPYWQPRYEIGQEPTMAEKYAEITALLERAARQGDVWGDVWGKFYLAFLSSSGKDNGSGTQNLEPMEKLANEGFPPAMSYVGAYLANKEEDLTRAEELLRAACLKREHDTCEQLYVDYLCRKLMSKDEASAIAAHDELTALANRQFHRAELALARTNYPNNSWHPWTTSQVPFENFLRHACAGGLDEAVGEALIVLDCFPKTTLTREEVSFWLHEQMIQQGPHTTACFQMGFYNNRDSYAKDQWIDELLFLGDVSLDSSVSKILKQILDLADNLESMARERDADTLLQAGISAAQLRISFSRAMVCRNLSSLCAIAMLVPLLRHLLPNELLNFGVSLFSQPLYGKELTPGELQQWLNQRLTNTGVDIWCFRKSTGLASARASNKRRDRKKNRRKKARRKRS